MQTQTLDLERDVINVTPLALELAGSLELAPMGEDKPAPVSYKLTRDAKSLVIERDYRRAIRN